jgi:hypothetical protein
MNVLFLSIIMRRRISCGSEPSLFLHTFRTIQDQNIIAEHVVMSTRHLFIFKCV